MKEVEKTLKESTEFSKIEIDSKGERSYRIYGDVVIVSLNPDTNSLIQVQPRR